MGSSPRLSGAYALAFFAALDGVTFKTPDEGFGLDFMTALVYLPELEGIVERDFRLHESFIPTVTELIEEDLKDNWIKTLLGKDSVDMEEGFFTVTLTQLIAVAKTSNMYPPEAEA